MLTNDIIRILMAGASVHVDCKKHTVSDLLMMANVAKVHKRRIFFENSEKLLVADRLRIALVGKDYVEFCDLV